MSLSDAQRALEYAADDLRLTLSSFDDDDMKTPPKETRNIVLSGKVKEPTPPTPVEPPVEVEPPVVEHEELPPEKQKQVWHPVMWHTPPVRNRVDYSGRKPHERIINNIRRFFTETKDPEERQRMVERLMLNLPAASKQKGHDPEEEEEERRKLAELRRLSLQMRGELEED